MDFIILVDAIKSASLDLYGEEPSQDFFNKLKKAVNDRALNELQLHYADMITKIILQGGKGRLKYKFVAKLVTHILLNVQWVDENRCLVCGGMYPDEQHKNSEWQCKHHNLTQIYFDKVVDKPKVNNPKFEALILKVQKELADKTYDENQYHRHEPADSGF